MAAMVASTIWLYSPVLSLELLGDDYHWVQHAHRALHHPWLLLADLDSFYRPASTWTLAVDRLLWPWWPPGYHATNLALHGLTALLLVAAARRLGLAPGPALAVGWLWAFSPWACESAIQVAIRFESLLLAAWCLMILLWPGKDEGWRPVRIGGVAAAVALAMASKETWAVTPALAWLLERFQRGRRGREALLVPALLASLALLYSSVYFSFFPSDKGYFQWQAATFAKIPQQLAGFFWLAPHRPAEFIFSIPLSLAVLATVALGWLGWRSASPAMTVGLGLLLLPALPTLGVPLLPLRHCAAPYAGFLLLVAGALAELSRRLGPRARPVAWGVAAAIAALAAVGGALVVRAELEDARRLSAAHQVVLAHARQVAWMLSEERPVLVVRAEGTNVLKELGESYLGWPKLLYVREKDPAALIDAAALFWWVRARPGEDVVRRDDPMAADLHRPGEVLIYTEGGFRRVAAPVDDVAAEARILAARRVRFRVIELRRWQRAQLTSPSSSVRKPGKA